MTRPRIGTKPPVWFGAALAVTAIVSAGAAEPVRDVTRVERRPREFFSIFNFGYASDDFPADAALFETIVARVATDGGFNAILCGWSEERAAICRKHGVKIMVDLLNPRHHVYKTPADTEALLRSLRGNDAVMGYHLWSDAVGGRGEGRIRDIGNCNAWDPTHPAYAATRKTDGLDAVACADIFGWYDFHWQRTGWNRHFDRLKAALPLARTHDGVFYSLLATESGLPGKGNFNRSLWSVNQGVAFGMKGVLWFIGMRQMDKATGEWTEVGRDINRVNAEIMPLREEIMRIGLPSAVYATPITRDANNRELPGGPTMLGELAEHRFPADHWIQPAAGEFTMGTFTDDAGREAIYVANLNAYAPQAAALRLLRAVTVKRFDRRGRQWTALPVEDGVVRFELGPAGGELLRFE